MGDVEYRASHAKLAVIVTQELVGQNSTPVCTGRNTILDLVPLTRPQGRADGAVDTARRFFCVGFRRDTHPAINIHHT